MFKDIHSNEQWSKNMLQFASNLYRMIMHNKYPFFATSYYLKGDHSMVFPELSNLSPTHKQTEGTNTNIILSISKDWAGEMTHA